MPICIVCKGNGIQAQGNQIEYEGTFSGLFSMPSNVKRKRLWCEALNLSKKYYPPSDSGIPKDNLSRDTDGEVLPELCFDVNNKSTDAAEKTMPKRPRVCFRHFPKS